MKKVDLLKLRKLLERIKDPDGHIKEMIACVDKDLAIYEKAARGLRDNYEEERYPF